MTNDELYSERMVLHADTTAIAGLGLNADQMARNVQGLPRMPTGPVRLPHFGSYAALLQQSLADLAPAVNGTLDRFAGLFASIGGRLMRTAGAYQQADQAEPFSFRQVQTAGGTTYPPYVREKGHVDGRDPEGTN